MGTGHPSLLTMCARCDQLLKAEFEAFVWRDGDVVRFANRMRSDGKFLDRVWPVFRREKRRFRRLRPRYGGSLCSRQVSRSILKSSKTAASRRWIPGNPLLTHLMKIEDAWAYRRR